jgi:ArsR family transcriptional regulator
MCGMELCCTPLLQTPLSDTDAGELADRFSALADPSRLRLLSLISQRGEVCACELVEPLGLAQPTISHHLKVLYETGLLGRERRGRWIHYWVDQNTVDSLRQALADERVPA